MGLIETVGFVYFILCSVRYFVLDEADKACDIEMENQIRSVSLLCASSLDCQSTSFYRHTDYCMD